MSTTESTTTSTLPPTTTTTTTTEQPTTSTTEGISMKSLMTGFKAVRRPLPVKAELEEKKDDARTVHDRSTPIARPLVLGRSADSRRRGSRRRGNCSEGMQEIWLAVENSQVNSSVRTSVIKLAAQPLECMESCQSLFIGKHPCDSFTFNEPAKRCIFHSSHAGFQVKPSGTNDFSTRAFRQSLTPFSDCNEFLAFRNYQLEITPREMFEDLPTGNEGISACIELCVLSHEFRCKSASFNTQTGSCWIYDEHSLSKPTAFKEAPNSDRLYFENGCIEMPIPAEARKQAKVQRIEPTVLDYRKLSKL
ncbi:hypothetical protein M3Y99_01700600 [Aphelenchoides fujianensis]|nr:hypothetical protein M3Y99_01700600 [Aphelenchoides fujianensis]